MDTPRSASVGHWGGGRRNRGRNPCRASLGLRASRQGQPPDRIRVSPPVPPADLAPVETDSAQACRDPHESRSRGLVPSGTRSRTTNQVAAPASRSPPAAGSRSARPRGGASRDNHDRQERGAPPADKARWPSTPPRQCYAPRPGTATFRAGFPPPRTSTADSARAQNPPVVANLPDARAQETDSPPAALRSALRPPSPTTPAGQPTRRPPPGSHDNGAYSPH